MLLCHCELLYTMITMESSMHVPRMRSSAVIHFMLTVTDEQYHAWWPGTHFRMHSLNNKTGVGQLICMDEMIGDRHLQMKCIVTELERNKITWQFVRLARLPCWLTLLIQDDHSGATITHTIRAGYAGLPGRLLDPLLRLYFSQKFARMMSEHFSFEFTQLPELIETLTSRETGQSAA